MPRIKCFKENLNQDGLMWYRIIVSHSISKIFILSFILHSFERFFTCFAAIKTKASQRKIMAQKTFLKIHLDNLQFSQENILRCQVRIEKRYSKKNRFTSFMFNSFHDLLFKKRLELKAITKRKSREVSINVCKFSYTICLCYT